VSAAAEPQSLGSLYDYALLLRQRNPDGPLPRDGEPYPDDGRHRGRRPRGSDDMRRDGAAVAAILDRHFADPHAPPDDLIDAFHDLYVPIHRNDHIAAAARRADRQRVRETGRWLVRHSPDRCSVTVGLALLATDWQEDADIPLIRTIGLLSNTFGALAAEALKRRSTAGYESLLWLAHRVSGWGRVYVVEALCEYVTTDVRSWLLRHACDGDYLNGYFAWKLATAAHLHAAIVADEVDDELVDHLVDKAPEKCGCTAAQRDDIVRGYLAVLDRKEWRDTMRAGHGLDGDFYTLFAATVARRLNLRAFRNPRKKRT
jgi:hypothetical protein